MFTRDYVRFCACCREVTAHTRRVFALPLLLVGACWIAATVGLVGGMSWPAGGVLALAGLLLLLCDRERRWRTYCNRCRGKQVAAIRRTKPGLDQRTEIFLG